MPATTEQASLDCYISLSWETHRHSRRTEQQNPYFPLLSLATNGVLDFSGVTYASTLPSGDYNGAGGYKLTLSLQQSLSVHLSPTIFLDVSLSSLPFSMPVNIAIHCFTNINCCRTCAVWIQRNDKPRKMG